MKKMSSVKVAPADEAYLRNKILSKRGIDMYAGGCDIRKTIKYAHMREASKKGFFEWFVVRLPAPLIVTNNTLAIHKIGT